MASRRIAASHFSYSDADPSNPEVKRCEVGLVVSHPLLRDTDIEQDEIKDIFLPGALLENLDRRDPETFLIDLGHVPCHGSRGGASDIGMMSDISHEHHEFSIPEDGSGQGHIRKMGASSPVGVV